MGDVIPFPHDRGQPLYLEHLRAYRDGLLALFGKLLAAMDSFRPALASDTHEAARTSLVAARGHLSAMDIQPTALAEAGPEQLNPIAVDLLLVGRQAVELARGVAELVAQVAAGRAVTSLPQVAAPAPEQPPEHPFDPSSD